MVKLPKPEVLHSRRVNALLLAAETIGVALILWDGVPLYNQVIRNVSGHQARSGVLWWAVVAVVLVQGSYWLRHRFQLPVPWKNHPLIGHVILFVGRLAFVFVTSVFSFVFLAHYGELDIPPHRTLMLLLLLFSMFCWNLDLERVGRALEERAPGRGR